MSKILLPSGVAHKIENGKRKSVQEIDVPEYSDCCKVDCCENAIFIVDKQTGAQMAMYLLGGTLTITTRDQYFIDKANGVFNF